MSWEEASVNLAMEFGCWRQRGRMRHDGARGREREVWGEGGVKISQLNLCCLFLPCFFCKVLIHPVTPGVRLNLYPHYTNKHTHTHTIVYTTLFMKTTEKSRTYYVFIQGGIIGSSFSGATSSLSLCSTHSQLDVMSSTTSVWSVGLWADPLQLIWVMKLLKGSSVMVIRNPDSTHNWEDADETLAFGWSLANVFPISKSSPYYSFQYKSCQCLEDICVLLAKGQAMLFHIHQQNVCVTRSHATLAYNLYWNQNMEKCILTSVVLKQLMN